VFEVSANSMNVSALMVTSQVNRGINNVLFKVQQFASSDRLMMSLMT